MCYLRTCSMCRVVTLETLRRLLKRLLLLTLPSIAAVALLLELVFRLFIPANDPPLPFFDEPTGIYHLSTERRSGLATFGPLATVRGRWRINDAGWNSPVDYRPEKSTPRIAVIGDSYVEALQVDADERFPSLLRGMLGNEWQVYSFGIDGAPLSQYLQMARFVCHTYDPDVVVITVVHNDFAGSVRELNPSRMPMLTIRVGPEGHVQEIPPQPDRSSLQYHPVKRAVARSALVRWVLWNSGVRTMLLRRRVGPEAIDANINADAVLRHLQAITTATDAIIRRLQDVAGARRLVFVMDAPREAIYEGREPHPGVAALHRVMAEACHRHGCELVDLWQPMAAEYLATGTKFNSDVDHHWNQAGHAFVAGVLFRRLGEGPDRSMTRQVHDGSLR